MVRIRLRRVGLKKQPTYRIVIQDKESPRDGRFIEIIGFYNPRTDPSTITLDEAKAYDWMMKGAQPTDSVAAIFRTIGTLERFARLKQGEALEALLAEAQAAEASRNTTNKTRKD